MVINYFVFYFVLLYFFGGRMVFRLVFVLFLIWLWGILCYSCAERAVDEVVVAKAVVVGGCFLSAACSITFFCGRAGWWCRPWHSRNDQRLRSDSERGCGGVGTVAALEVSAAVCRTAPRRSKSTEQRCGPRDFWPPPFGLLRLVQTEPDRDVERGRFLQAADRFRASNSYGELRRRGSKN